MPILGHTCSMWVLRLCLWLFAEQARDSGDQMARSNHGGWTSRQGRSQSLAEPDPCRSHTQALLLAECHFTSTSRGWGKRWQHQVKVKVARDNLIVPHPSSIFCGSWCPCLFFFSHIAGKDWLVSKSFTKCFKHVGVFQQLWENDPRLRISGKPYDSFVMPVPSFNVRWHKGSPNGWMLLDDHPMLGHGWKSRQYAINL